MGWIKTGAVLYFFQKTKGVGLKKLSIGIQTFETMITENRVYVDKTPHALQLLEGSSNYFFLSRPRRFGKSLFLSTLKAIFQGKQELFEGLHIYDKHDWSQIHPVIHLSLGSGMTRSMEELRRNLKVTLGFIQEELGIVCEHHEDPASCFRELIHKAHEHTGAKVVILIDEYDKPILDAIDKPELAAEVRDELKSLYSVIKDADPYIRFVFITGVSKFSKISLFSGLNNLYDITIDPNFSTICGITQSELEHHYAHWLNGVDREKVKEWYNGYQWMGEGVYNPFGMLNFLELNCDFRPFWFGTATPTFLLKLIQKKQYFLPDLEKIEMDESMLDSFDIDSIELETLMWQSGYLTITDVENLPMGKLYHLKIPNKEVRIALYGHILHYLAYAQSHRVKLQNALYQAIASENLEGIHLALRSLFAAITYRNFTQNEIASYEGYYASVVFAYLASLGLPIEPESTTNKGQMDLSLQHHKTLYLVEFKMQGKAEEALAQIKSMKYHEKYLAHCERIYLIGIGFDVEERNVSGMVWEQVGLAL